MGLSLGQTTKVSHTFDGTNKRDYLAVASAVNNDDDTGDQDVIFAIFDPYDRNTAVRNHRVTIPAGVDTSSGVDLDYLLARRAVREAPIAANIVQAADPALVAAIAQQILSQLQQAPQGVPQPAAVAPEPVPAPAPVPEPVPAPAPVVPGGFPAPPPADPNAAPAAPPAGVTGPVTDFSQLSKPV